MTRKTISGDYQSPFMKAAEERRKRGESDRSFLQAIVILAIGFGMILGAALTVTIGKVSQRATVSKCIACHYTQS